MTVHGIVYMKSSIFSEAQKPQAAIDTSGVQVGEGRALHKYPGMETGLQQQGYIHDDYIWLLRT
jgi:hypothetical protein